MADRGKFLVSFISVFKRAKRTTCGLPSYKEICVGAHVPWKTQRKRGNRTGGTGSLQSASQEQRRPVWRGHYSLSEQLHVLGVGRRLDTRADQPAGNIL